MTIDARTTWEQIKTRIDTDPELSEAIEQIDALIDDKTDESDARLRLPYSSDPPPRSEKWKMPSDA